MDSREKWKERLIEAAIGLVLGLTLLGGAPLWWHPFLRAVGLDPAIAPLKGGCGSYTIYAQGRWDPLGAALRAKPDGNAKKVGGFGANEPIVVNGWVHGGSTLYPNNPAPYDNDIWFHLANDSGWVSFGGTRAEPVDRDPTDRNPDGGVPAPTPQDCASTIG